jgi:multiple sugar transport system permease protein
MTEILNFSKIKSIFKGYFSRLINPADIVTKKTIDAKIKIFNRNLTNIIIALFIISIILFPYGSFIINSLFNFSINPPMISLISYIRVINNPMFQNCLINSLIVSVCTTLISLCIGIFASYALSRIRSRWKKTYEMFLYILQMFPGVAFVVPYFIIFILIKRYFFIQMQNTYHGLILTYTSFALPFSILMLKNFINAIPKELDEQAQIDGCSRFNLVYRVIVPLAFPGILAVAIFSFIISWNEILFAYTLTKNETMTASIYIIKKLQFYSYNDWMDWNTACLLVTLPVVIGFALLQKKMISGLSTNFMK